MPPKLVDRDFIVKYRSLVGEAQKVGEAYVEVPKHDLFHIRELATDAMAVCERQGRAQPAMWDPVSRRPEPRIELWMTCDEFPSTTVPTPVLNWMLAVGSAYRTDEASSRRLRRDARVRDIKRSAKDEVRPEDMKHKKLPIVTPRRSSSVAATKSKKAAK